MRLNEFIDVLIPRGGAGLIKMVVENSTVPVIETGTGNCHIYVDADADFDMAIRIILNAKTQRVGVCNACESLVIHESICDSFLPKLYQALREKDVEIHADDRAFLEIDGCVPATEADYGTEYLALKLSVKTVSSLEEAIGHINRYNTGHSEAIITNNEAHARTFLDQVDAACVYVNASTRFTDGFEFGFGAEIGISTQMLHAQFAEMDRLVAKQRITSDNIWKTRLRYPEMSLHQNTLPHKRQAAFMNKMLQPERNQL